MRPDRMLRLLALLAALAGASPAPAQPRPEAFRILVPVFFDSATATDVSARAISLMLYFEILKAYAGPGRAERGSWILYGHEALEEPTHRDADRAARWPSISADLVFWGSVLRLGDDLVVEPYLTRTSVADRRRIRPETFEAVYSVAGERIDLSISNSASYFDLSPFVLSLDTLNDFADLSKGFPIYASPTDNEPDFYLDEPVYFLSITDEMAEVQFRGEQTGWLRFPRLSDDTLTMIEYGRGLINVLRGNWIDARRSFAALTEAEDLPNALRVNAFLYLGLARHKLGQDPLPAFREAHKRNPFNKDAARFLLLGLLAAGPEHGAEFGETLDASSRLFGDTDPWIRDLRRVADSTF